MGESNRTVRQRLMDRSVVSILLSLLVIAIIFPYVNNELLSPYINLVPLYPDRPSCRELPAPLGGNQRSLLAYETDDTGALELELSVAERITVGSNVKVAVTFKNTSRAPIILHFPDNPEFLITTDANSQGINFLVEYNGNNVGQPGSSYSSPLGFDPATLHLLGPRSNCIQEFTLPWSTLQIIGVNTVGTVRIRARYGNTSAGNAPSFPDAAEATPIPEYQFTQGVWIGEDTSNEELFEFVEQAIQQPVQ
ncbi:MAG: hypothetical protein JXA10_06375 [Anaerolineae bacterium]|nr:hypothetical protein [Anaerolineae bacterium]